MGTFSPSLVPASTPGTHLRANGHKRPCPICGGDGCAIFPGGETCSDCNGTGKYLNPLRPASSSSTCLKCNSTGKRRASVVCRREPSPVEAKNGVGHVYYPDSSTDFAIGEVPTPKNQADLAPIEARDAVYRLFLELLPLYPSHQRELQERRGLSDKTILRGLFTSLPKQFEATTRLAALATKFNLRGIPGCYLQGQHWQMCFCNNQNSGYLIPLFDPKGRVQALQLRSDKDEGKRYLLLSSGPDDAESVCRISPPNHWINFDREARVVVVTEGALKAWCASDVLASRGRTVPMVGAMSNVFGVGFASGLKFWLPKLGRVIVALDEDVEDTKGAKDTEVRRKCLIESLEKEGLGVSVTRWERFGGGKVGVDDLLGRGDV